jgi:hypothetical protein
VKGATVNGVTYEGVAEFIFLGTLISNDNSVRREIQRHILAGNRTYFAGISLFRSRPGENGGGQDVQKDIHSRTGRDETKGKTQERMERGSRKRSSSAGNEKLKRVADR